MAQQTPEMDEVITEVKALHAKRAERQQVRRTALVTSLFGALISVMLKNPLGALLDSCLW